MKIKDKLKIIRAFKRQKAIEDGQLSNWRMQGKTQQPKKGKGVPYNRTINRKIED